MILLRTTRLDGALDRFADELRAASGEPVAMLVDERKGPAGSSRFDKVGLTEAACRALGLFMPADFAWRCGDYGFYLARAQFPGERVFWMIENDVRIGGDAQAFFEVCRSNDSIDFLAAHLRSAEPDWWWRAASASSDARPYRCFFPVVRLTGRAVDLLREKRSAQSRSLLRRGLWPNDESFVATTIANSGLSFSDLNDLGSRFYDDVTFSYYNVLDGAGFASDEREPRLHHPVLFGDDYARKIARLAEDHADPTPLYERAYRKALSRLNGLTTW